MTSAATVAIVAAAGVGAYALTRDGAALPPGPMSYPVNATTGNTGYGAGNILPQPGQAGYYDTPPPETQSKIDLLLVAAQGQFMKMSAAERQNAADYMNNSLGLQPPLRGNEDWQQIVSAASGFAGAAACNAIPGIGTAASPLCAIGAAYVGVQLEQWLEGNLPQLKEWVKDNIGAAIEDAADSVIGWFKGLF